MNDDGEIVPQSEDEENDDLTGDVSEHEFDNADEDDLPSSRADKMDENLNLDVSDGVNRNRRCAGDCCYAVGDPHFRSFDGDYFHFQGIGEFRLAKTKNMEVQGRTFACGRHRYYGAVGCYDEATVKYTRNGVTRVIQVNTRGSKVIKENGKRLNIKHGGSYLTKAGNRIHNAWHGVIVVVTNPDGSEVRISPYAIYIWLPRNMRSHGLCGNHDHHRSNDYTDAHGKVYRNIRSNADKVDNDPRKPIHTWGMTFMVKSKNNPKSNIESLIANPDKWNHPEYKPKPYKFKDDAERAKAHKCCKDAGFVK